MGSEFADAIRAGNLLARYTTAFEQRIGMTGCLHVDADDAVHGRRQPIRG